MVSKSALFNSETRVEWQQHLPITAGRGHEVAEVVDLTVVERDHVARAAHEGLWDPLT